MHFSRNLGFALALGGALLVPVRAHASELIEVQPLTDSILMLHFNDGHVEHHKDGQARSDERVITDPLDVVAASKPSSYSLSSPDDPAYRSAQAPRAVNRKTKGTDFAWFVDKWDAANNRAINERPDHTSEHWLYLQLPSPLREGKTYSIQTGELATNGKAFPLRFSISSARSDAVHVNTLGYVPGAPQKFAYVYAWMGDGGSMPLSGERKFYLVDAKTNRRVFSGSVAFRAKSDLQETSHKDETPGGNFLGADVWECDFSAFGTPGRYVVAVEGVGCSFPFEIGADVYRPAFYNVARALYHNRSGIALSKPYTTFERPAPHNPKLTPGFAGKLRYTKVRWQEWGSEGGDPKALMTQSPGELTDTWGWYQDAGDWDGYPSHFRPAIELMLAYETRPRNFSDGELNIPESGNGVPDILDEAAWEAKYLARLRAELLKRGYGTGGVGMRVAGDAFGTDEGTRPDGSKFGRGSWQDTDRTWMVSGEDPWSTFRYAGVAANLAFCLQLAGAKPLAQGVDWKREALECFAWAQANIRPGDQDKEDLNGPRAYAAAALFRLTGDPKYEQVFADSTQSVKADSILWESASYAPAVYALGGGPGDAKRDPALLERMRSALIRTADEQLIKTPSKRALRWGGNYDFPMLVGQQTTPWIIEGIVGYALVQKSDPAKAKQYLGALYTTADYFLGTNPLNFVWMTGVGPRHPTQVFHMDSWYRPTGFSPGIIPYGPWRKQKDVGQGPWDSDWPNSTVYPVVDNWPGGERWWNNRCSPLTSEFTVHQQMGPAAAAYGWLCGEKK